MHDGEIFIVGDDVDVDDVEMEIEWNGLWNGLVCVRNMSTSVRIQSIK